MRRVPIRPASDRARSGSGGYEMARWGGTLGGSGHARVYAMAMDHGNTRRANGSERPDQASKRQAGFRADWEARAGRLTLQGDAYEGGKYPANNLAPKMSGANLIAFTTGRGSMFGAKPVPSVKLATNTPMYRRLTEDMDINCGEILDGTATMAQMGERIFELMLRVASGERTKSELLGLGDHEFVPWNIGVTS